MHMNSGKSMDDILDSIRKIVHEEETGEARPAPAARKFRSERGGEMETLVLTRDMRVDQDDTLHLSNEAEATEEEREAIAALRLRPEADDDGAADGEEILTLRADRGADHSAEVAAFDAALAEDDLEEEADVAEEIADDDGAMDLSALDEAEGAEVDGVERDAYGFAVQPRENPYRRRADEEDAPRGESFSLRVDSDAIEADEADEDEDPAEDETGDAGMAFSLGGIAEALRAADAQERAEETAAEPVEDVDPVEDVEEDDAPEAAAAVDDEEIRRMVREAVREELTGALGDRITRNIRGMVRREIKRAMETKQIT